MINAIAIDDEPVALNIIRMHAEKISWINLVANFRTAREGLKFLEKNEANLIFLDINMPGINGLEFARLVDPGIHLVFTTAHSYYAIYGFDMAITDFLLKPINFERFLQACTLVQTRCDQKVENTSTLETVFVKDGHNLVRISISALMYVKADDNYVTFVERGKYTVSRMRMNEVLTNLQSRRFLRVHKSYIVNLDYIERIESNKIIIAKAVIPVSRLILKELKERM